MKTCQFEISDLQSDTKKNCLEPFGPVVRDMQAPWIKEGRKDGRTSRKKERKEGRKNIKEEKKEGRKERKEGRKGHHGRKGRKDIKEGSKREDIKEGRKGGRKEGSGR